MALPYPSKSYLALGANTSLQTSNPWFSGDLGRISVSVTTGAAAASRVTIVGSDADGLTSTLSSASPTVNTNNWSQVTAITSPGVFVIDPGPRWLMAIRDTSNSGQTASNITVLFTGSY